MSFDAAYIVSLLLELVTVAAAIGAWLRGARRVVVGLVALSALGQILVFAVLAFVRLD